MLAKLVIYLSLTGVDVGQDIAEATLGLDRYPKYVAGNAFKSKLDYFFHRSATAFLPLSTSSLQMR